MKVAEAWKLVGGLSKTTKMPGWSYGLPAGASCPVGSRMMLVPGSVCSGCYALKGRYRFDSVTTAQHRRLATLTRSDWTTAMAFLLNTLNARWFRWHDSGDLQNIEHLEKIIQVAIECPKTNFWLPTREIGLIRGRQFPKNLTVRVSMNMVNGLRTSTLSFPSSAVVTSYATCPAPTQGGKCLDCRACWDRTVQHVTYLKH